MTDAADYYFKPNVNGIKLYYNKITKERIAKSKIPSDIIDDIVYCEKYKDTKEIVDKREKKEQEDFERKYKRDEETYQLHLNFDGKNYENHWEEYMKVANDIFKTTKIKNEKQYQSWLIKNPRYYSMFMVKLIAKEKGYKEE